MLQSSYDSTYVANAEEATSFEVASSVKSVRRCPTLPHPHECSTIGAGGLSFRVRDGTGRFPTAIAAETLWKAHTRFRFYQDLRGSLKWVMREPHSGREQKFCICYRPLVPVSSTRYRASTSGLSTPCSIGGLRHKVTGNLILKLASRLDAFSGYPFRT